MLPTMKQVYPQNREVMMRLRVLGIALFALGVLALRADASPTNDLESAIQDQKVAFILVTEPGTPGVDQARQMIRDAVRQVNRATMIEVDRSTPANAEIVAKLRLSGVPVPLILVAARTGALAGGLPAAQLTVEKLVAMVPSPKQGEILKALQDGKSAFIIAGHPGMSQWSGTVGTCATACSQMGDKCQTIQIDIDDPQEKAFLTQLKVNLASMEPVTLVINAQGQVTGTYAGAVELPVLVQAATKRAGGCCPPKVQGGAPSCPPTKKQG